MSTVPDNREYRILRARVDAISRQRPVIFLSNVLLMTASVAILWSHHSYRALLLWWSANAAFNTLRAFNWYRSRARLPEDLKSARRWLRKITAATLIGGMIWGIGAWTFLSAPDITVLLIFLLKLIGVTNGAMVSYADHYPIIVTFSTPISLFTAHKLATLDAGYTDLLATATLAFLIFTLVVGRNYARVIGTAISLDIDNAELLAEAERQKETAERANQDKSRFFAAVSHDIRQPLYAMGLLLESFGERLTDDDQRRLHTDIQRIHQAIADMFASLLEMSQLDSAAIQPNPARFNLDELVRTLIAEFEPIAAHKSLSIEFEPHGFWVETDPMLLARVLRNLISNAIKFTDEGGITIECNGCPSEVTLSISDTGSGIVEAAQEVVFSEYVQLGNPERDRANGLGLGLAVVRRLSNLLDLRLELESAAGVGTTFSVRLPRVEPTIQTTLQNHQPKTRLTGLHTIVIDDEADIRSGMTLLLSDQGCAVTSGASAAETLLAVKQVARPPDIILCDYRLPGEDNGIATIARIRASLDPQLPAALITGDTDPEIRLRASEAGLELRYKPVPPDELIRAIAELV